MKKNILIAFILIACQTFGSYKCYSQNQTPKHLGKAYQAAKKMIYLQEYEKAAKILDRIIENKKSTSEQKFYSKLLWAQLYSEGKELNKALEVYNEISHDKEHDMPVEHVCRYLDLLRRNGFISRAIEVAKKYHVHFSTNDRFVNIESALNSYYQYYQNKTSKKHFPITTIQNPNAPENSYAYGITPYGNDFILLTNQYNFSEAQSFFTNGKMVLLSSKRGNLNYAPITFTQLRGFVQQGPATFFNKTKSVIFTANQYTKYNTGNRPYGSVNRLQLYFAKLHKNKWTRPVNISHSFIKKASKYSFLDPSTDEEGKVLYFASDMKGGFGGMDIYYSKYNKQRKRWSAPINMGQQVNTSGDELAPFVKNDTLLFSSNGLLGFGDQDIFMKKISAPNEPAIHLPYPVNTQFKDISPMVDAKNNLFFLASDRKSPQTGFVLEQVYSLGATLSDLLRNDGKEAFEDEEIQKDSTLAPINSMASLIDSLPLKDSLYNDNNKGKDLNQLEKLNHTELDSSARDFFADQAPTTRKDSLHIIHFELDRYTIRKDQYLKLDSIYNTFMAKPNEFIVAIEGHTDATGTEKHNFTLSEKRAKSVKEYLMRRGIPAHAFQVEWFGFTRPMVRCNQDLNPHKNCQDINKLNRRCELYIKRKDKKQ